MLDSTTDFANQVHLPWGYLPSGRKVRAACSCGFLTTARVDEARALAALLTGHGYTDPVCAVCEKNHHYARAYESAVSRWDNLRHNQIEILTDDGTGGTFLVCRGMPPSCRPSVAQQQTHTDASTDPETIRRASFSIAGRRP